MGHAGPLEAEVKYKFKRRPCNIRPDHLLWCVSGQYEGGGGVLQWCYNEQDANRVLAEMQQDPEFSNLRAHPWQEPQGPARS